MKDDLNKLCKNHPEFDQNDDTAFLRDPTLAKCTHCRGLFYGSKKVGYFKNETDVSMDTNAALTMVRSSDQIQFGNIRYWLSQQYLLKKWESQFYIKRFPNPSLIDIYIFEQLDPAQINHLEKNIGCDVSNRRWVPTKINSIKVNGEKKNNLNIWITLGEVGTESVINIYEGMTMGELNGILWKMNPCFKVINFNR